ISSSCEENSSGLSCHSCPIASGTTTLKRRGIAACKNPLYLAVLSVAGIGVQQNQRRARTFLQLVQQGAPVSRHVHLNGVRNTAGLVRNHPGEDCRKENSGK